MDSSVSFWWFLLVIPALIFGVTFGFFPKKVVKFRAKLQYNSFKVLNLSDEEIDNLPGYSLFYGDNYSEHLKSEQERPEDHRLLVAWTRTIGLFILILTFLAVGVIILAIWKGLLIVH